MMTNTQVSRVIMQALTFLGEEKYTLEFKPAKMEHTSHWIVTLPQHREMVGLLAGTEEEGFVTSELQIKMDVLWTYLLKSHPESRYLQTCLRALSEKRLEADNAQLEWLTAAFLPEECSNDPLAILTRYYASREASRLQLGLGEDVTQSPDLDALALLTRSLKEMSQYELAARIYYKKVNLGQNTGSGG